MIDEAFKFIKGELNNYFNEKLQLDVASMNPLELGNAVKIFESVDGNDLKEKIVLSLVNIEEDRISKNPENFVKVDNKVVYKNPKVHLNLYCLFVVNKSIYTDALQYLSLVIQFFQYRNVFNHTNSPALNDGIDKLIFDLNTLNFEQVNHLWGILGGKYIPSVMYRMRMITIDEDLKEAEGGLIKEIELEGVGKNPLN